jgi:hypothetical protein
MSLAGKYITTRNVEAKQSHADALLPHVREINDAGNLQTLALRARCSIMTLTDWIYSGHVPPYSVLADVHEQLAEVVDESFGAEHFEEATI